ncbi:MAG: peptide chain release factor 1 [Synergistetes bacterium]|nr:MAG: Peptide chain release factor 1 [bacterium 42_11]MBC7331748.1 peptide chain release factor 1 [Synergistota bacterium]MDK2871337.1 peptide chain release factor 1 [bacterium]
MWERLKKIEEEYESLSKKLSDPAIVQDPKEFQRVAKTHAELEDIVIKYRKYKKLSKELEEAKLIAEEDEELREVAKEEAKLIEEELVRLEEELKTALIPKDPMDDRNIIMEIRAGAGGEEAALFAADLFRMYARYAERKGWDVEVLDRNETGIGGYKEIVFRIIGKGAYSRLKFESGVHRVQRIPVTESSGRIHTSTATVAVLPEVEDVEVEIKEEDLKIETFRASGKGGQYVNKTDTAVRITHIPTGIVVSCQDERSQYKNKQRALSILRAKLYEIEREKQESEIASLRKSQVGSGERSEKIRTYNFPQNRVTDHRIGLTLYNLEEVLDGDLDDIIEALIVADRAEKLAKLVAA